MKLYKLTDANAKTRGGTEWGPGVSHSGTGEGELCGPGWIHAYADPLLAVLFNPIHARFPRPRLWEAEGEVSKTDGLKVGCRTVTTSREIPLPEITTAQKVAFAILAVKEVCDDPAWNAWADRWLSGEDRSESAAWSAARSAESAAARSAEWSAALSAWSAARSAESAARSAWSAAESAARSAESAARSAWSAARSAESAAGSAANKKLDFAAIARKAVKEY